MNSFPEFYFEGIGGIRPTFNFIPTTDIDNIPYSISTLLTEAVELLTGKQWFIGRALPRTLSLNEKYNEQTQTYFYILSGRARGTDAEIIPLFSDMATREFLLDVTDNNGNRRLLGCNEYGASFIWEHDTQESASGRNDFKFTFEVELKESAKIYTPAALS